jgi:hypothetical protein
MSIPTLILRLVAALLIAAGLPAAALAQDKPDNWLTRMFQPSANPSVLAPAGATR